MKARGKGPLAVVHTGDLWGESSVDTGKDVEGLRDEIWQKMTVHSASLSLLMWLYLAPRVSSGNMPGTKCQIPKSLVAMWGEDKHCGYV